MTTPRLALPASAALSRPARRPFLPRLAFPVLMIGMLLVCAGYLAVGVLLLRAIVG